MRQESRLHIRIDTDTLEQLKEKTMSNYTNVSEVIKLMINLYLSGDLEFESAKLKKANKISEHIDL